MNKLLLLMLPLLLIVLLFAGCQATRGPAAKGGIALPAGSTGDPPAIPHEVGEADGGADCLGCHRDGDGGTPKTTHPELVDCRQCHILRGDQIPEFRPSY